MDSSASNSDHSQAVICCSLDPESSVQDSIIKLLKIETSSVRRNVACFELELKNKYYRATIGLFDFDCLAEQTKLESIKHDFHAIILYGNGQKLTTEKLDEKLCQLDFVGGEPRILLCHGIDEDCKPYETLLNWSIQNGYDLMLIEEENIQRNLIDSLSAYKWPYRSTETENNRPQLNDELMKKLTDFDSLLGKLSAYRDRPELRGNPDDKNIEEIAEILSGLLGDDVDNFLDGGDNEKNRESVPKPADND